MGAKTDVIVKLVFVFFISLLSFSIGTFVGKKYSDNQHQLAALEPNKNKTASDGEHESAAHHQEVAHNDSHSTDSHASESHDDVSMSDDEIAKLAEEFVSEEDGSASAPTESKVVEHKADHKTDKKSETHEVAAHKLENTALPSAKTLQKVQEKVQKADTTRVPSSLPKDVGTFKPGKFTVQVASYSTEKEAQTLTASLKGKGYAAFYIPADIKGKTWYRVSVGQFNTLKEAKEHRTEMLDKAHVSTAIVQKIAN